MSEQDGKARTRAQRDDSRKEPAREDVLQVERRDYTQLAPTNRPRSQSLRGFDEVYTDIVDYIVRCTHRIWDERDVGLIYTHYTHNAAVYYTTGAVYDRETIVNDTIQRLVSFPERRGMATQVIWGGDDEKGFYTSHLVTGSGRHTQYGHFGKPTGRTFVSRTIADCMVYENKIYREWIVADNMAIVKQLGLDADAIATERAQAMFDKGLVMIDIGENRRLIGQNPPDTAADLSIAHTDGEARLLKWLHEIYNRRMFGEIERVYARNAMWHGPLMKELYGSASVTHQTMALVAAFPDAAFIPQHVCSVACEEGGEKIAVRWVLDGHHLGFAPGFGKPTGHRVITLGISHFHVVDGKIVDDWTVYDQLSMLQQIKLAEMVARA